MQLCIDGLDRVQKVARRATAKRTTGSAQDELVTYRRAVRQHCMDCSGGSIKEADRCKVKHCALWVLRPRMGKEDVNG